MNNINARKIMGMCALLFSTVSIAEPIKYVSPVSLYAHLKNNNVNGNLTHNIASFAGTPSATNPLVFKSNMAAETGLTTGDFFDTTVGDLDGDGKDEVINFYFDSSDNRLKIGITSPNNKIQKKYDLYSTSQRPRFDKKLKDTGVCTWIQVETLNSNADRVDDILITQFCGETRIWKANNNNALSSGYTGTRILNKDTKYMDKVSIATGNINIDSAEELVIGYSMKLSAPSDPYIEMFNITPAGGISDYTSQEINITVEDELIKNANGYLVIQPSAITIANIDDDALNEIIIGGGPETSYLDRNQNMLAIGYWDPSNTNNGLEKGKWGTQSFFWTNDSGDWSYARQEFPEIITWDAFNWGKGSLIVYGNAILQFNWNHQDLPSAYFNMVNKKLYNASGTFPTDINYYQASIAVGNIAFNTEQDDGRPELYIMPYYVRQDKSDNVRRYHSNNNESYLLSIFDDTDTLYPTPQNLPAEAILFKAAYLHNPEGKTYFDIDYSTEWMLTHPRPVVGDF